MTVNAIDFLTADPATLPASVGLNAWLAEKRMGWRPYYSSGGTLTGWHDPVIGRYRSCTEGNSDCWSPSTNHGHAGEARRKAGRSRVYHLPGKCIAHINSSGGLHRAVVLYTDVTGNTEEEIKGKAEALAVCRAIVAAIQVRQPTK